MPATMSLYFIPVCDLRVIQRQGAALLVARIAGGAVAQEIGLVAVGHLGAAHPQGVAAFPRFAVRVMFSLTATSKS